MLERASLPVLIVEDDQVNIEIARRYLERRGVRVEQARDGVAAVEAACRQSFGCILMDWHLPGIDGLEATRRIRIEEGARGAARVPIVAMTATVFDGAREQCLDAGMDDFVEKPISAAIIDQVIARWVTGSASSMDGGGGRGVEDEVPIDPSHLSELFTLGGVEIAREVVDLFSERGPKRAAELDAALEMSDAVTLANSLHSLRGMASQLGLIRLAGEARALEEACKRGELLRARIAALPAEVERSIVALRALLEDLVRRA